MATNTTKTVEHESQPVAGLDVSMTERVTRWLVRASLTGFGISLICHVAFLVVAAVWHIGVAQSGGSGGRDLGGKIDVAIMTEGELGAIEEAALDVLSPGIAEIAPEALPTPEILDGLAGAGEAPSAGGIGGIGDALGTLTGAGGDIEGAIGLGETGAGGGAANFFGVEAVGTRFAYIIDVSGSMQGQKLRELKIEIIESVTSLTEHMQFFIVPFSTDASPLGGRNRWTRADETGKEWARDRANEMNAYGGTNPLPALQIVFDIMPRPDAIYFMTDGLFDAEVPTEVAKMNKRGKRVPIHTIGFDMQDPKAEEMLKRIAEESGGRYSPVGPTGGRK